MKKTIDGKRYNTETAEKVEDWTNGHYTTDFNYCAESLYRAPNGVYFLHGEGHAMSIYARHSGNDSGWGEAIQPLSKESVIEWYESRGMEMSNEMAAELGVQETTTTITNLRDFPVEVWIEAKHRALDDGISAKELVIRAVRLYLGQKGKS